MSKILAITGAGAMSQAMRQINPDVVPAFPITPSTQVVEDFSQFVADGLVDTEFITVESEHSAMSACIGASIAGGRVMTATSSAGMALMWEMLYVASSMRQPVVLTLINRAMSAPINIHADHSDSMGARDAGWIQLYSESNQEAYDNLIMAPRIAEASDVRLPIMICLDGFIISHCVQTMQMEDDDKVREFIGEFKPAYSLLDTENPVSWGALDLQDYYIEHKRAQHMAMQNAKESIKLVSEEFYQCFGRKYELFESYCLDDAERVIIAINSIAGEIKEVVDDLRNKGEKVGLLKIRSFRPFPYEEIAESLKSAKIVTVLDRSESMGAYGPLFTEIRTALFDVPDRPMVYNRMFGLGGRELFMSDIQNIFEESNRYLENGKVEKVFDYLNVRGG
ncbi:MAG: pyruvate ferredoxin oxidoreductase [Desulfobacterales bacterium]|jgi:pyruvate ferredoxin oxidoreductase alpha subunit|nr:pyruvate ferredoxin oxidoreductase [Desulfobacteraceae bacterium]MBT4364782.1 pyruvate ferredoxin oxidoreductase [Desulfobacteraceae bacterium]MBT7086167.1 pyruvate ferredoxin oxidoreductase [Desulfobacterales bacterium]MBT7698607.1 pyruvate ferredoxin oxidoreductase [Desulfobacterales bacterium]